MTPGRRRGFGDTVSGARHRQNNHDRASGTPRAASTQPTTPASLRTDLAIAREQIKALRTERDKLQQRLRLHLGAELEAPDRAHLTARVADLETINRQLVAERDARAIEAQTRRRRNTVAARTQARAAVALECPLAGWLTDRSILDIGIRGARISVQSLGLGP